MVELGKYAIPVLLAYGISLGLILALVALSLIQAARVRAALRDIDSDKGSPYG